MSFDIAMAEFAALDTADLVRPWTWRDKKTDVRYALYRTLEEAQEAVTRASAGAHPESRRILALAQRVFGDLRGLVVGVPAQVLERQPAAGEWSVMHVLRHVQVVEERYMLQTAYAVDRSDADPIRIPDGGMPKIDALDTSGDGAAVLSRIAAAREATNRRLGDVPPAAMTRPTIWAQWELDVRFRLHRFASHIAEHTVQCEKTLAALAWPETEGRRVVRQIWSLVGELEGLGAAKELAALAAAVEERRGSVKA
jgi:hypothetical protein